MKFSIEYHQIPLDLFRDLPSETYSEGFFRAGEFSNAYVDAQATATLATLGGLPGEAPRPAWEIASQAGVRPERMREFRWLLWKLAWAGRVAIDRSGAVRARTPLEESPAELRAAILSEDPSTAPTLDLIDAASDGYPSFLRGLRDGTAILFNSRVLPLWERYFSSGNRLYGALNLLGAHAAAGALGGGPVSILEVGGGLGSGAEALLSLLKGPGEWPARIARYTFTELSPGLLRRGQDRLLSTFPGVPFEFLPVDLNRSLVAQGVPEGAFHLVYAVNTLHAVRDLVVSLGELHGALVPGGLLVLVEGVRPSPGQPLYIEYVFQLLREFREFRRDPECRPHGGFLLWKHWQAALRRAGFEAIRSQPDHEAAVRAYPRYAMAAILARRPAEGAWREPR